MNNFYNSGGVPPLPPHLQDSLNKCGECGHVFVGSSIRACPRCNTETGRYAPEEELPGMWEKSDLTGGQTDAMNIIESKAGNRVDRRVRHGRMENHEHRRNLPID